MYSNVAQTLTAKGSKTYGNANGCNGSVYGTLNNGVNACWYSTGATYANRASACASGYTVCSFAEANAAIPGTGGYYSGWVELAAPYNNTASNSFEVSDYTGGFTGMVNYSGYVAYFTSGSTNKCRPVGGGTQINNCSQYYATSTLPSLCCPVSGSSTTGIIDNCEVSINSTEPGYLQSPQFKGGTPF